MPIDTEKVGDPAGRKGAMPFGEDAVMKNGMNDELVKAIGKLSEAERQQVTEFVSRLTQIEPRKRSLSEILKSYSGGQSFKTADEVDTYLRGERDSWDP